MSVYFLRRGEPPVLYVTVKVASPGDATYCYAIINGTKRYSIGTFEVHVGDTITFGVYGYNTSTAGWVKIDGTEVLRVTNSSLKTYDWTVPCGISTIEIRMSSQTHDYGRITVTTA